jgi:hypothetical protein
MESAFAKLRCKSLPEFLEQHPFETYLELASILDSQIAASQIYGEQIRIAVVSNTLRSTAADCLARCLRQHLKRGWGVGMHVQRQTAAAYAQWKSILLNHSTSCAISPQLLDAVWNALKSIVPFAGWKPSGREDAVIRQAFQKGWTKL